jgi:predicted small metal-binding protein
MCGSKGWQPRRRNLSYKIISLLLNDNLCSILVILNMYKLECRQVGFDCSHTMTGNTEEEVLQRAKEHGTQEHNLKENEIQSPEMQSKLRSLIRKTD